MHASLAMDGRRTVPEDRQDSQGLGGPIEPRAAGINKAALFTAASLVAASLPLITVVVLQNVELNCGSVGFTLIWLGIACTTAAISLGIIGRVAAAPGSELRALSTFAVVLGVIELVAILAFTMFALALREATTGWGQM